MLDKLDRIPGHPAGMAGEPAKLDVHPGAGHPVTVERAPNILPACRGNVSQVCPVVLKYRDDQV